jgi:hypothetical protein
MNIILQVEDYPNTDQSRVTLTPIRKGAEPVVRIVPQHQALGCARQLLEQAFTFEPQDTKAQAPGA